MAESASAHIEIWKRLNSRRRRAYALGWGIRTGTTLKVRRWSDQTSPKLVTGTVTTKRSIFGSLGFLSLSILFRPADWGMKLHRFLTDFALIGLALVNRHLPGGCCLHRDCHVRCEGCSYLFFNQELPQTCDEKSFWNHAY